MIEEKDIHKAIDFLCYKAPDEYARAKEVRVLAESLIKTIKSELYLSSTGTIAEREATALTSEIYKDAVQKYAQAVREEEYIKQLIDAAKLKIELYRTEQASQRAMKI